MTKQIKVLTPSKDERIFSREAINKVLAEAMHLTFKIIVDWFTGKPNFRI